jgi:predicted nucleic acid-binding protein
MGTNISINIREFYLHNIIDSCSISNLISSNELYVASINSGCRFYCTNFVLYECLYKNSEKEKTSLSEFRDKLKSEIMKGNFKKNDISVEDLQEVEVLYMRKKLSKGELSAMVFAKKTGQAFLTDDQKARILGSQYLSLNMVQTIPQLFGWLFYNGNLLDADKAIIIEDHIKGERPLAKYFEDMYLEALQLRLADKI